jgi:hypothetical protein
MHRDERERLRQNVATESNFQLYRSYSERDAAERIGWDYSTLKRKRRAGLVPFVDRGGGSVAYMGYQIADIMLFGVKAKLEEVEIKPVSDGSDAWAYTARETTGLAIGGSDSAPARPPTTASDTMPRSKATSALALARQTLNSPKRS